MGPSAGPSRGPRAGRGSRPRYAPPASDRGCATCPGGAACDGAPSDYVARFGRYEIDSEGGRVVNPGELPPTGALNGDIYPPPRAGRFPASKLAYVRLATQLPSLADDPLIAVQRQEVPAVLRTVFVAPSRLSDPVLGDRPGPSEPESTRRARVRLVALAQHGAKRLRIASAGSLNHPAAAELLRECTRLQIDEIEVAGEAGAMTDCTDMQLRRLRGITRFDVALFSPDPDTHDAVVGVPGAFEAALDLLDRISSLVPKMRVGCYAVLRDHAEVAAWAEAWDEGDLPGDPWFRLAPQGGSLADLAAAASELPEGPARLALARVLPKALFPRPEDVVPAPAATEAWGDLPPDQRAPSGADRLGCYTERPRETEAPQPGDCPGYAVGWSAPS